MELPTETSNNNPNNPSSTGPIDSTSSFGSQFDPNNNINCDSGNNRGVINQYNMMNSSDVAGNNTNNGNITPNSRNQIMRNSRNSGNVGSTDTSSNLDVNYTNSLNYNNPNQPTINNTPMLLPNNMTNMALQHQSNLLPVVNQNNDMQQLPTQSITEKIQLIAVQMAQLKGQITVAQANVMPQTKDIVNQMIARLNYLQDLYIQLVNIQQQQQQNQLRQFNMMNPMMANNNPNFNMASNIQQQQFMQQFNQQQQQQQQQKQNNINNIRAMQALQQRMLAIQMMNNQRMKMHVMGNMPGNIPGNIPSYMLQQQQQQQLHPNQQNIYRMISPKDIMNNNFPNNQSFPNYPTNPFSTNNNNNTYNSRGSLMPQNRLPIPSMAGRRRRKRSDSQSSEFSSSPEPTRKEIDDLANVTGPLRRSMRAKKQKSYAFDLELDELDDTLQKSKQSGDGAEDVNSTQSNNEKPGAPELVPVQMTSVNDNNVAVIDKILADRIRKSINTDKIQIEEQDIITKDENDEEAEEEFYVKYKYYSYLHCEWLTLEEMKLKDRLATNKVKRYKQRKTENIWQFTIDDEYFNPDYVEVDRILAKTITDYVPDPKSEENSFNDKNVKNEYVSESNNDITTKNECVPRRTPVTITHYLTKWCSLPYEDSTWEPEDLIDDDVIKEFETREKSLTPERIQFVQRPNMTSWSELPNSPIYKEGNSLRDYQLEGLNWLRFCYYRWQNCILADEMGLGKTIQSIALIDDIYKIGIRGPFLIIAPLSTIHNWYREFKTWTDLNVIMFHGTAHSRNIIHKYELYYTDSRGQNMPNVYKFDALITTYEMILSELKFLSSVRWRIAVVDEAHRLKNKKCKLLESLSFLQIEHRVLLTGTPLQNSLEELYSLLSFLDPQNIPSERAFMDEFGNLQSNDQVAKLQRVLKPIMLRRLKEDVEKNIAPKEETIIEVEMTSIQRRIYKSILEKNFSFLSKGTTTSNMPNLMNTMMELRKCCNHPFLIKGCEDKITSDFYSHDNDDMAAYQLRSLVESSGKLVLVDKLLPKLKSNGHRVLLFSQMVKVLDIIEEYLLHKKYLFERIDGSIRGNMRQAAIDRFSRPDSDRFIFLLCTKAGGLGINLTAADTVIIFDSDWNPQNDIQAQARCHRIGQSKFVKVYRLICRNSYERKMFDRASLKLGLDKAVLQSINNNNSNEHSMLTTIKSNDKPQLSKKDIEDFLKVGAYGALFKEETAESAQFCAEDIDQILERRATTIQIAGEGQGSTFAKASFQSGKKDDIDVDDPLFWEKWAQKAKLPLGKTNDLIYDMPRERKTINYDDADSYYTDVESDIDLEDFQHDASRKLHISNRTCWLRVECFKVEKQLLIFGWGRWEIITLYANFKTLVAYDDVIQIARCILVYCWHFAKVDASTKNFIEGVIKNSFSKNGPSKNDDNDDYNYKPYVKTRSSRRNSGKRSKRMKEKQPPCAIEVLPDWKDCDPDLFILDTGYRKHLQHNANKILLRIRLLYVLQNEIIGKTDEAIMTGVCSDDIDLLVSLPSFSKNSSLACWWNEKCDKSLLIGTFKHGYEKYKEMLLDTQLIFHELIPEEKLLRFIKLQEEQLEAQISKQTITPTTTEDGPKRRGRKRKQVRVLKSPQPTRNTRNSISTKERDINTSVNNNCDMSDFNSEDDTPIQEIDEDVLINPESANSTTTNQSYEDQIDNNISDEWPHASDLNTRFRRLVTSFWKSRNVNESSEKPSKKHKSRGGINSMPTSNSGGPVSIYDIRLSKKEENEFYKLATQFGFEFDCDLSELETLGSNNILFSPSFNFKWDRFRMIKSFEKRTDEQITMLAKYMLISCVYVLDEANELNPTEASQQLNKNSIYSFNIANVPDNFKPMEGITIDKAIKLLNRLDMLEMLRNNVLLHEDLEKKLRNVSHDTLVSSDFPDWWDVKCHDYMLLRIVDKYGIAATDKQMFMDKEFDLHNIIRETYEKAQDNKWGNFVEQYNSMNDLTCDMMCAIIKWPKQRGIISRVHKLLYFVLNGKWPSKNTSCEERYRTSIRLSATDASTLLISNQEIAEIPNDKINFSNNLLTLTKTPILVPTVTSNIDAAGKIRPELPLTEPTESSTNSA